MDGRSPCFPPVPVASSPHALTPAFEVTEMSSFTSRFCSAAVLLFLALPVFAQRDRDTYTGGSQTFEVAGMVRLAEKCEMARNVQVRLERFGGGGVAQIPM